VIIFRLLEVVMAILAIAFFITQIIIPIWHNTLMFPWFRRQGKLEAEETRLNQKDVEDSLEHKLEQRKQNANKEEGKW
jgi:hypothetical protein